MEEEDAKMGGVLAVVEVGGDEASEGGGPGTVEDLPNAFSAWMEDSGQRQQLFFSLLVLLLVLVLQGPGI